MKKLFVLLFVLAISSTVFARTNERGGQIQSCESGKQQQEPQKEKPDYRSIIVDAWLVQVSADALYESGVKPFSEKDKENVSVMNLLWCLSDPNNGKVVVSATTRALVQERAENSLSNTMYWGESTESYPGNNSTPVRTRTQRAYDQKIDFRTYSNILENKQVWVEWLFTSDFFVCSKTNDTSPPESRAVNYQNITIVSAKKPVIVAQTQIGDDMFFLVLRAEIVD